MLKDMFKVQGLTPIVLGKFIQSDIKSGSPIKIVLFGSHARREARAENNDNRMFTTRTYEYTKRYRSHF